MTSGYLPGRTAGNMLLGSCPFLGALTNSTVARRFSNDPHEDVIANERTTIDGEGELSWRVAFCLRP